MGLWSLESWFESKPRSHRIRSRASYSRIRSFAPQPRTTASTKARQLRQIYTSVRDGYVSNRARSRPGRSDRSEFNRDTKNWRVGHRPAPELRRGNNVQIRSEFHQFAGGSFRLG